MKDKTNAWQTRNIIITLLLFSMLVLASAIVIATTGIVTSTGAAQNLYFVGSSSNPSVRYQDAISPNPDVGLELCGESASSYVGAVYAIRKRGVWDWTLVSYGTDPTDALAPTSLRSGDCYITSPMGSLTISPSRLASRTPDVHIAAFPGYPFILNSSSQDGSSPQLVEVSSSRMMGSFNPVRSFLQTTNNITVSSLSITFQTDSGTFSKASTDSDFGIDDDRHLAIGSCNDTKGIYCDDGYILNTSAFPLELTSDVVPSEASTFTRYVVVNGLGYSICIGPDLNTNTLRLNGSTSLSVFSGELINISGRVTNSNNVAVTSSFDMGYNVGSLNPQNFTISGLAVSASSSNSFIFDTSVLASGGYTVTSTVYDSSFGDCNDGNDDDTASLTIMKTYRPYVWIDGVMTDNFTYAGRPYNVTIEINDSDGNRVVGAKIVLVESNGLNLFAPQQIFNTTGDGLQPLSSAVLYTNATGTVSFAIIPTGNKLYEPAYAGYNVSGFVGNYSMYFEIFNPATDAEYQMAIAGQGLVDRFDFNLLNMTVYSPNATEQDSLRVVHQTGFLQQIVEYVDQAFAAAYSWLDIV